MNQVERANFGYFAAASHLSDKLSDSRQQWQLFENISRFDLFISFAICCTISRIESDTERFFAVFQTHQGHSGYS